MASSSIATTVFNGVSTVIPITATATSLAASIVQGGSSTTPPNPLLEFQPGFTRSLVIQVLVLSCVATLTLVLLLHLAFTTRYHFPLAKANYLILTSGCFLSFVAILWQLGEIGLDTRLRAREWPFMFDYLEFVFPANSWSVTKAAVWLTFNAIVVFLCHAAHIHVLTLLYPSKLEARFLLAILLPLALIGVALSYSPLINEQRQQDIFDSGSAVCNSTLTLLYTCALLFWGLYIARARAWGKTDESGSTAVFGGCAIGMAMIGTALSFVSVRAGQEQAGGSQGWLARITWLVLLWQSWFTVWWWIGAGMYNAERPLEDLEEEEEPQSARSKIDGFGGTVHRAIGDGLNTLRRRRRQPPATAEEIEMASLDNAARTEHHVAADISSVSDSTATTSPPTFLATLLRRVRRAHINAAKQAQRDLLHNAQSDPNMNDAIQGRRGKGWSVSGILKSREDTVIRSVSANAVGRMSRTPSRRGDRDDHRVGAARLDDSDTTLPAGGDWEDVSDERQQYPPAANLRAAPDPPRPVDARTARWTSWRRKDVTRYD